MKFETTLLFIVFGCFGCFQPKIVIVKKTSLVVEKSDTALVKFFITRDFDSLRGEPVSLALSHLGKPFLNTEFEEDPIFHANELDLIYSNYFYLRVVVESFEHMKQYDEKRQWNINEFYKEKFYGIKLFYKNNCIKGCEDTVRLNF